MDQDEHMKCKKCEYHNPEGAKYCGKCGNRLGERDFKKIF